MDEVSFTQESQTKKKRLFKMAWLPGSACSITVRRREDLRRVDFSLGEWTGEAEFRVLKFIIATLFKSGHFGTLALELC